ncbi:MAG TPA: hypothetical protein VHC42_02235 [Rhizomicrobium sp.]|nr:hypothetical protein [Rhizomicrobium sp.]
MSSAFTVSGACARLRRGRPIAIVDADEVILRFVAGFERFLSKRSLRLDLSSYRLHGNVRRNDDGAALLDVEVTALLEEFRSDLDWLEPVEGAQDALAALEHEVGIVVLTNIAAEQAPARSRNLGRLGFDFPLVANTGPKGPVVRALSVHAAAAAWFVDDIPHHLASAAEHAPDVARIHLVGDSRLRPLLPPSPHANLYARDWPAAVKFILDRLKG